MSEHYQSPMPQHVVGADVPQLKQLQNALADAESRIFTIPRNNAGNYALALKVQEKIIAQYKRQIAELTGDAWLK